MSECGIRHVGLCTANWWSNALDGQEPEKMPKSLTLGSALRLGNEKHKSFTLA